MKTRENYIICREGILLILIILILSIFPSCDKKNKDSAARAEQVRDHSLNRPRKNYGDKDNVVFRVRGIDYVVDANDVDEIRLNFKNYLARHGDTRSALDHWLEDSLGGLELGDRDRVAAKLLYAISDLAYQEGGEYIAKKFTSRESRLRSLTAWLGEGAKKHNAAIFSLLKHVIDDDERSKLAGALGARVAVLQHGVGIDWVISNIDSDLLHESLVGFFDVGDVHLDDSVVMRLVNDDNIDSESRTEIIKFYTKKIAEGDPLQALNFLKTNNIDDLQVWKNVLSGANDIKPEEINEILSMIPPGMTTEKSLLLKSTALKNGLSVLEQSLSPSGELSSKIPSIVAAAFAVTGNFDDNLNFLKKIPDLNFKKKILERCIEEAIVNGMPPDKVSALESELNDNNAYKNAVKMANASIQAINKSKVKN